ncbi:MAG: hypothetical protein Q7T57_02375 [Dehalococcoidales bacterium]|nr:hypothetical protein [Dehalococcoidales bacterium]
MKNQYFGDNRDLFKYDLVYHTLINTKIKHFVFIPMLTKSDDKFGKETNRNKAKAGINNYELRNYLDNCVVSNSRDIRNIDRFFSAKGIETKINYNCFTKGNRNDYFNGIDKKTLGKSVILVDPDNGLEVKKPSEKHVLWKELSCLYDRMSNDSILMVFQFFPYFLKETHCEYLRRRASEISEYVSKKYPLSVDDNQIAFFLITKDEIHNECLSNIVKGYSNEYKLRSMRY